MANSLSGKLFGGKYKKTLHFVPNADKEEPQVGHEISEHAIFRFLLNEETLEKFDEAAEVEIPQMLDVLKDIDKQSEITQVEAYRSSMNPVTDTVKAYHVFMVFKTTSETVDDAGDYWWSLEKNSKYIVLQRSRNKDAVKDKLIGEERNKVKLIEKDLKGKGTIQDLFAILWAHQIIPENYNILNSNCQFLVTFVGEQITEVGYKFKGFFPYSPPPESGRDKKMLELINVIRDCSDWPPLFHLITMGNTDLVDKTVASGNYDINASCNGLTPLHLAIRLEKTKMVKHLLQPPMNADPTKRDASGKSALLFAISMIGMKEEIFDLLLANPEVNVDDVDENGQTSLHLVARASNVGAVQKLLDKGANPNIVDNEGLSPLHVAALTAEKAKIFDLLVAHEKVKVDDVDEEGRTALHFAASASNVMVAKYLINKGANPNNVDKRGYSPLLMAAMRREGNAIIDLLLEAQKVKGIGDVNDQNKQGRTALHFAAAYSNEITAEHLIKKGANVNCRTNDGRTPLHVAALGAYDMKIIDLLLQNINEGDIQQYKNNERLFLFARHNLHGLGNAILDRLLEKSIIKPQCTKIADDCTAESDDEATGVNTRRFVLDKGADPSIDLTGFDDGLDFLIARVKKSLEIDEILKKEEFDINGRDENGDTLLLVAILGNNVNAVRLLLEKGADPTIRDKYGYTPFYVAVVEHTDFDILNLLLESGKVDINETTKSGSTALHMAIMESNTATAEFLLSKGANPNVTNVFGCTPLHYAAEYAKDMDIVELLLNHKDVDVNYFNNLGSSALFHATLNEHGLGERIANRLKEKGAVERENGLPRLPYRNFDSLEKLLLTCSHIKPDEIDNFLSDNTKTMEDKISKISKEYLISAITDSDVERVRLLLKNGADIRTLGEYEGNALHVASLKAKTTDIIDAILETGKFDINGVDNRGWTPLHFAMLGYNATNARYLLEMGADLNIANKNGVTPLHLAAKNEETTELIDILLETGKCNINGVDNDGWTPLHYAIERYAPVTINARHLIKMGADPGIADKNGVTPLHMAARNAKTMDLIELLLNTEAVDVNCVDKQGRTPLACARDNKHGLDQSIIARLKESGAKEYLKLRK